MYVPTIQPAPAKPTFQPATTRTYESTLQTVHKDDLIHCGVYAVAIENCESVKCLK